MRYIDADLLQKEIKRRIEILKKAELDWSKQGDTETAVYYRGKSVALDEFTDFIDYLQPAGDTKAEKDLALTIENLELLHTFLYAVKNNKQGAFTFTRLSDEQYNEALRRFREAKK